MDEYEALPLGEALRPSEFEEPPEEPFVSTYRGSLNFPTLNTIQQEALSAFMRSSKKHGALVAPVGTGKTILAARIWAELGEPSMLVVVPRIVLIHNPWLLELAKLGISPWSVGQFYSEIKQIREPITMTLYQTLLRYPDVVKRFKMVVYDEADVLGGEKYSRLLLASATVPYVIGLTGTIRDAYSRSSRLRQHLPRIVERTISEAREQNLLVNAEVIPVTVNLNQDEQAEYNRLTEIYRKLLSQARGARPQEEALLLKRSFMVNMRRLILLSNSEEKTKKVVELVMEDHEQPTLIYSSSVANIKHLQAVFVSLGIKCDALHKDSTREDRDRVIAGFGKKFNVLLSVGVLARGYNVREVTKEILIGTTSNSLTAIEQRLGRALRTDPNNPGKKARIYVMVASGTIDQDLLSRAREALTRLRS